MNIICIILGVLFTLIYTYHFFYKVMGKNFNHLSHTLRKSEKEVNTLAVLMLKMLGRLDTLADLKRDIGNHQDLTFINKKIKDVNGSIKDGLKEIDAEFRGLKSALTESIQEDEDRLQKEAFRSPEKGLRPLKKNAPNDEVERVITDLFKRIMGKTEERREAIQKNIQNKLSPVKDGLKKSFQKIHEEQTDLSETISKKIDDCLTCQSSIDELDQETADFARGIIQHFEEQMAEKKPPNDKEMVQRRLREYSNMTDAEKVPDIADQMHDDILKSLMTIMEVNGDSYKEVA